MKKGKRARNAATPPPSRGFIFGNPVAMDGNATPEARLDLPLGAQSDWWIRGLANPLGTPNMTFRTPPQSMAVSTDPPDTEAQPEAETQSEEEAGTANVGKGKLSNLFSAHPYEYAPILSNVTTAGRGQGDFPPRPPDGSVIMGVIDDGIALANARFLKRESGDLKTRALFFWNQDADPTKGAATDTHDRTGADDKPPFGYDWFGRNLAHAFHDKDADGYPKEEVVYRRLQMDRLLSTCAQHGTHVMDLATGYDCDDTTPNELGEVPRVASAHRPIIAVQLSRLATGESSGAYMSTYVTCALDYILLRAVQVQTAGRPKIPLVLNFSYGIFAGALSGNHHMEEWIDHAVRKMWTEHKIPVWVTLPSGNSHLSRTSGLRSIPRSATFETPTEGDIDLRIQPDNKAPTVIEFWWPETRGLTFDEIGLDEEVEATDGVIEEPERKKILAAQLQIPSDLRLTLWPPNATAPVPLTSETQPNFFHGVPLLRAGGPTADGGHADPKVYGMVYHERLVSLDALRVDRDGAPDGQPDTRLYATQSKLTLILAPSLFEQGIRNQRLGGGASLEQTELSIDSGTWRIALARQGTGDPEEVTIRVQRGDTPFGYRPFGRQGRLEDRAYRLYTPTGRIDQKDKPDQWVKRAGTISAIGTGRHTIRVGSYRLSELDRREIESNDVVDGGASAFTSAAFPRNVPDGWTTWRPREAVDVAAATELSHTLPGVQAAGTHSGSTFRFAGTSSAAPQIARWIAHFFGDLDRRPTRWILRWVAAKEELPYFEESTSRPRTGSGLLRGPGAR